MRVAELTALLDAVPAEAVVNFSDQGPVVGVDEMTVVDDAGLLLNVVATPGCPPALNVNALRSCFDGIDGDRQVLCNDSILAYEVTVLDGLVYLHPEE